MKIYATFIFLAYNLGADILVFKASVLLYYGIFIRGQFSFVIFIQHRTADRLNLM